MAADLSAAVFRDRKTLPGDGDMRVRLEISFPAAQWAALIGHLFGDSSPMTIGYDEQLAFALAAPHVSAGVTRLAVREIIRAGRADLTYQSSTGIAPNGEFVAAALTRCRREGWSLIEVHSHPFGDGPGTTFSGFDWLSDREKMPRVAHLLPDRSYHATMVIGRDSLDAHYYDRETATIRDVHQITVHGVRDGVPRISGATPTSAARSASTECPVQAERRYDR